jgi:hypothetical protein
MRAIIMTALAFGFLVGCQQVEEVTKSVSSSLTTLLEPETAKPAAGTAHGHIGHVMSAWDDTPNNAGLLPTALAEADVAREHAGFAAQKLDNLSWMRTHAGHVLHAVAPDRISSGPGLGYGVIRASEGVLKHIDFASRTEDASDNVKHHAEHVGAAASNTVLRANEIVVLVSNIQSNNDVAAVAAMVRHMAAVAEQLRAGKDLDSDGEVQWDNGEGGLDTAVIHMEFMMKGENLI